MNRAKISYCFGNNIKAVPVDGKFAQFKGVLDLDLKMIVPVVGQGQPPLTFAPNNNTRETICMVVSNPEFSGSRSPEIFEKNEIIGYNVDLDELEDDEIEALYTKIDSLDWSFRMYLVGGK